MLRPLFFARMALKVLAMQRIISLSPALALLALSACGSGDPTARAGNVTQQEADALNDAAAIIDERTDKVENALSQPMASGNDSAPKSAPPPQ